MDWMLPICLGSAQLVSVEIGAFMNRLSAAELHNELTAVFECQDQDQKKLERRSRRRARRWRWRSWTRSRRVFPDASTSATRLVLTVDNKLDLFGVSNGHKLSFYNSSLIFRWACWSTMIFTSGYCFYLFFHLVLHKLVEYGVEANSISIACKCELYVNAALPLFTFYQPNPTTGKNPSFFVMLIFWEVKVFACLAHIKFKARSGFIRIISANFVYLWLINLRFYKKSTR